MAAKKEPVTWKPGWNGQAYKGDDWVVANSLVASRKLTKAEQEKLAKGYAKFLKKSGKNVTVTKAAKGFKIIGEGK
jgi:hypothetical protein